MHATDNNFKGICGVVILVLLISSHSLGRDLNKQQQYNPNNDFLLHESGGIPSAPKKDHVSSQPYIPSLGNTQNTQQSSGKRDYFSQFPPLGPSTKQTTPNPISNPNLSTSSGTTRNPQSSGKRDYVAPQLPTGTPTKGTTPNPNINVSSGTTRNIPSGKRDYVAPNSPTGNIQPTPGKVKDLVNFYDNMGKGSSGPQKVPSYSSILQNSGVNNKFSSAASTPATTRHTQFTPSVQQTTFTTKKPLSFSAVAAGSTKPSAPFSTPKPATNNPTKPGSPVLPSSVIANNNKQGSSSTGPSDAELQTLSEELLRKDTNNAARYITINYQEKTTSQSKEDKAPLPLMTVGAEVWNIPTIQKFVPLLDNYERDTLVNEYVTPQERHEENDFMDAIMSTAVIRHLMNFLKDKGYVTPDPKQQRDFLKQLWFSLYSRGKGKISSSGFEHVFVSELKNGEISGLHNWVYFSREEAANRANYLGYLKYFDLSDKGVVMKLHFSQQGVDKPVNSMFIGTSPELEIALYTLCFVTRADNDCNLKLGKKSVNIITFNFRYRSKNLIGSAYPQI